jgi:hypothetical protein
LRILLDQNVPAGIRRALEKEHRVETTYRLHWEELTNGELLAAAEQGGFDIFITLIAICDTNKIWPTGGSRYRSCRLTIGAY